MEKTKAECGTGAECCCGSPAKDNIKYIAAASCSDAVDTPAGKYPRVYKTWKLRDYFGAWRVRLGINRMGYAIEPGMYALNNPDENSPILVSSNYKLSFDVLRREAGDLNVWILVIDSKGVNVWCAAGKGTFCAEEIARVAELEKALQVVAHKTLVLPQLSAPGVAAYKLPKLCGFKGIFGPVEARDIKEFLNNGMKTDKAMREVSFGVFRRLEVAWLEFTGAISVVLISGIIITAGTILLKGSNAVVIKLMTLSAAMAAASAAGSFIFSMLLPYMPGRMFSPKGALLGGLSGLIIAVLSGQGIIFGAGVTVLSAVLSSYIALNYTGATTFTSLTGVKKELSSALPVIIISAAAGLVITVISFFAGRTI